MKRLKSLAVVALALATFGLIGCSSNQTEQQETATKAVKTVKGEVEIPANPQRIVDISGSSEELVLLMEPRQEEISDELKEIAPTVMLEDQSNDWEAKLKDVAALFGQEEAEEWLDAYYTKAEKLGKEIKEVNGEDTTYLTVLASSGSFMVFSEGEIGTVLKDDMKLHQPSNMPEQDSITLPTVTMKGLSEIDADHIIVISTEYNKADLEASSVWSEIRSVKEGNVTILDTSPYFSQAYNPIGRELILESVKDPVIE